MLRRCFHGPGYDLPAACPSHSEEQERVVGVTATLPKGQGHPTERINLNNATRRGDEVTSSKYLKSRPCSAGTSTMYVACTYVAAKD